MIVLNIKSSFVKMSFLSKNKEGIIYVKWFSKNLSFNAGI